MMSNEARLPSAMHQLHSCYGTWTNSTPTLRRSLRWRAAYAISYHAQLRADWPVKLFAAVSFRQALRRTRCQQPNASGCAVRGSCLRIRTFSRMANTYMGNREFKTEPHAFPSPSPHPSYSRTHAWFRLCSSPPPSSELGAAGDPGAAGATS